ncbi:hypothetical protein FEZ48_03525 [Marinilactibacillus psychrotolerans]|uniref:Uncharacterized protein n=1 Tax=Marinilactibacillus psychrotolerans TaxID=191770 RepID=A0A5R9C612_9LACT|nr:hypothetical protein [Marinilactibacillus psychrotolerans]TLQ08514.1 hypothetical protein FEZ48_03525 [Marinilactibacillus psychrotolerans]
MGRFSHLKHVYVFKNGSNAKVSTPFVKEFSEIESEVIEHTPQKIVRYSKYPKGFELLVEQYSDQVINRTNYPLKKVAMNKYVVELPSDQL